MKKGKIIILSGPSGSGKTTLYNKLLAQAYFKKKLVKSVSVTTRKKRLGEQNGRDYVFISKKMFLYKKKAGHFLESEKVFDNYYGTPQKSVRQILMKGKSVLLCIDVKGANTLRNHVSGVVGIFVKTPSLLELKKRLEKRGTEDVRTMHQRLSIARQELKDISKYDYVVVNKKIEDSVQKLSEIIRSEIAID